MYLDSLTDMGLSGNNELRLLNLRRRIFDQCQYVFTLFVASFPYLFYCYSRGKHTREPPRIQPLPRAYETDSEEEYQPRVVLSGRFIVHIYIILTILQMPSKK